MALALTAAALSLSAALACAQQVPDSSFKPRVAHPAYASRHPRLLFDEAHHNFHTTTGRYATFARLVRADGYEVTPNTRPFSASILAGSDVLVIANALGEDSTVSDDRSGPAFTADECAAVVKWVSGGGALLLIADHTPFGEAARALAESLGVDMSGGFTADASHADPGLGNPTLLAYSRANGLLGEHPITSGRDSSERVSTILAFTGQSLLGPAGSVALMKLTDRALDYPTRGSLGSDSASAHARPAAGRAQGIAFALGRGRVVVLGEAAMLSAQKVLMPGRAQFLMGMNHPGTDNLQFTLNVMHWLTRLI
jgi:hypothetical protein